MAKIKLAKKAKSEAFDKDEIDRFTVDDPNYVDHTIIGDNESVVKVAKNPGMGYQWKLVALDPATKKPVTLMTGTFLGTVHEYEEFVNMDPAEALAMISHA